MSEQPDQWIAAETVLSDVDGEAGRLILRGFDLETLAGHRSYEEVVFLLWHGVVESHALSAMQLRELLGRARTLAYIQMVDLATQSARQGVLDTSMLMQLLLAIPERDTSLSNPIGQLARFCVAAALASRISGQQAPVQPDPMLGHAADFLRMLRGGAASSREIEALDTYLVTAIDHGLNASTFTARVIASTQATMQSALIGGFAALTGPLHGGAPGPVLDMLDAIGAADQASAWIEGELASGRRLMGFGHRIYRVRDPRADVLKAALVKLAPTTARIAFAEKVEAAALHALNSSGRARRLDTNTEFYTALLLDALDIPRDAFTPVFALARAAGWIAHIAEQRAVGRLIRPLSSYVGEQPKRAA